MKIILALFVLLPLAKGEPFWGDLQIKQWPQQLFRPHRRWFPPQEPQLPQPKPKFVPPGHGLPSSEPPHTPLGHQHIPPGHRDVPPEQMQLSICQLLEQLMKLQQQIKSILACHTPNTNSMNVVTPDTIYMVMNEQQLVTEMNDIHNNNTPMNNSSDQGNPNIRPTNENSTPSVNNHNPPQDDNTKPPLQHGGEGLIDIRLGNID